MYQIEKDVPVAPKRGGRGGEYPFAAMEIGDSFFVPGDAHRTQYRVSSAVSHYAARTGRKFTTRRVEGGVRCWRTA